MTPPIPIPLSGVFAGPGERRFESIDQSRGFAILCMLLGNFMGKFSFMPPFLTHHPYGFTLAETIAPLFILLVGTSYRLSFWRHWREEGLSAARKRALRRYALIFLLGLAVYPDHFWDALTHIGMAGLLFLPVIHRGPAARLRWATGALVLYQGLYLFTGYETWVMSHGKSLNGGPLAALSWGFILGVGTLIGDALERPRDHDRTLRRLTVAGSILIVGGYVLSLSWPGVKSAWPYTRWGMSAPLPVTTTGIALIVFGFFYMFAEKRKIRFPLLTPLGRNPILLLAVLGAMVGISRLFTLRFGEPSPWLAVSGYFLMSATACGVAVWLDRKRVRLRF